jgi:hypothetical protein
MAYYTALINAWNTGTVPGGVTGSALTGQTTAVKLANINAWTVTGVVPTTLYATGAQIANCFNWTEFAALLPAQQTNLLALCSISGPLLGGSANTANIVDGMLLSYFSNHAGATITNLTALAQGTVQPWWQANGYGGPFNQNDLTAAGGLT